MATLQTLRNKAGVVLTVFIGVALLAFILGDLLGSGNNIFSNQDELAVIDGETVKIQDYQQRVEEYEAFTKMNQGSMSLSDDMQNQIRETVWQQTIQDITFGKQYEKAGIDVTADELFDMVAGNHIAQEVRALFTDPQTGIYDRLMAQNFLANKNADPQAAFYWSFVEKNLKSSRKATKYALLLRKSAYCTAAQLEFEKANRSKTADIEFVSVRYTNIPDSTIVVPEQEIRNYYTKNKETYRVSDSRDIEYVSFPIVATEEDRIETEKYVAGLKEDFASPETDAVRFAQMNAETPAAPVFRKESEMGQLAEWVAAAKVGEVYGPYRDGDAYCISRLVAIEQRPDTVKARHILIRENEQLADSLLDCAKRGDNFAELARKYSEDTGSAINGGDLGWFADGMMVPEFNEACFTNAKGAIVKVVSDYGYHIINVQDKGVASKKFSVATIDKQVQYSNKTHQAVFNTANTFAINNQTADKFRSAADTANLIRRPALGILSNAQTVNSVRHARELVKWAFGAKEGEVSDLFECGDEFIVAVLNKKQEKGYASINDVAQSIQRELRNQKKTDMVKGFAEGKTLAQVADNYKSEVQTATGVAFSVNSVAGAGLEPNLVGAAVVAEVGKPTIVKGNNAVYVFAKTADQQNEITDQTLRAAYQQQFANLEYSVSRYITNVDIEDNRINFY